MSIAARPYAAIIIAVGLALFCAISLADNGPQAAPASQPSVLARQKYDAAIKEAKDAYDKAEIAADQQYIADLDAALNLAMTNHDLELVEALAERKKQATALLDKHHAQSLVGALPLRDFIWERTAAPMASPAMVTYKGKLYVLGGVLDNNVCSDAIWIYDPDSGKWEQKTSALPYGVCLADGSAPIVVGDRILMSPGFGPNMNGGVGQHNRILAYDLSGDTAEEIAEYPGQDKVWGAVLTSTAIDGESRIYCFGGWNVGAVDSICKYDAAADKFDLGTSTLSAARAVAACTGDRAGHVVLFGGTSTDRALVEVYDARTETLESLGDILPDEICTGYRFAWCDNDGRIFVVRVGEDSAKAYEFNVEKRRLSPVNFTFPTPLLNFDNSCKGAFDTATGRMYLCFSRWRNGRVTNDLWIGKPVQ